MLRLLAVSTVLLVSTPAMAVPADMFSGLKPSARASSKDGFAYASRTAHARLAPAAAEEAGCLYLSATKRTADNANYNRADVTVNFRRADAPGDGADFSLRISGQPSEGNRIRDAEGFGNVHAICLAPGKYQIDSIEVALPSGNRPIRFAPVAFELEPGKDHYLGELAFAEKYENGILCVARASSSEACRTVIEVRDALARDEPLLRSARTLRPRGELQRLALDVPANIAVSDRRGAAPRGEATQYDRRVATLEPARQHHRDATNERIQYMDAIAKELAR
jgi:hypothetical protein